MKRINSEHLVAGCSLAGIILLFGSFLFETAVFSAALIVILVIAVALLLNSKKCITIPIRSVFSLLLCAVIISNIILPAYATETSPSESQGTEPVAASNSDNDENILAYLRSELAVFVETYQLTPEMSDQDLVNVYFSLDSDRSKSTWEQGNALLSKAQRLDAEDAELLSAEDNTKLCLRFYNIMKQIVESVPMVAGVTVNGTLPNGISASDDNNLSWTISATEISVSAEASSKTECGGSVSYTKKSGKLTLSMDGSAELAVEVSTLSGPGTVTLNGTSVSAGSKISYPQETSTLDIEITAPAQEGSKTSLVLKYGYIPKGNEVTISFQPVASISYTVNTNTTVNTEAVTKTGDPADGFTVAATSKNYILTGATLVDESGKSSTIAAVGGKLSPTVSGKLTPIFEYDEDGDGIAPFMVGTTDYWNLTAAAAAANSGSNKTIVLKDDYTLPAVTGGYTIPSGVTLLIPFDAANTLYTTSPKLINDDWLDGSVAHTTPYVYRTLTMAEGASITVNGTLSLSAKVYAAHSPTQNAGSPDGAYGHIQMEDGSSITVNNGAALYAWGYITGNGSVTANSGATIYECFQINDFRGGDDTTSMKNRVFPNSQYYVQNIEVSLTLYAGAKEYAYTAVHAAVIGAQGSAINFFGTDSTEAMFRITSGYVTKKYDGNTDRLLITLNGDMSISPLEMAIGTYTINSANYELPINSNVTIHLKSGSSVNFEQNVAFLPGTQVIIDEGAECVLGSGISVFVYDQSEWGGYASTYNNKLCPVNYAPSKKYNRTEKDLVDAFIQVDGTLDASAGYLYTTKSGANIHSKGNGIINITPGDQTITYQFTSDGSYPKIDITSAKLKNENGSYVDTSSATKDVPYNHAHYVCEHDATGTAETHGTWYAGEHEESTETTATCTEAGTKTVTCACGHSSTTDAPALGHNIVNHICTNCGLFEITAASMTMANSLDMNFAFRQDHAEDWTGYYAVITRTSENETVSTNKIEQSQWKTTDNIKINDVAVPHYYVTLTGIAGKEMTDPIAVTIYNAAGEAVSFVWEDSVQAQAMRNLALDTATDLSKTMVVDMLNYGTAAQTNFGYRTDAPANKLLSDAQRGLATGDIAITNSATVPAGYKANVYLVSNIQFMMAFKDINPDTAKAVVSFTDHYGDVQNDEITDFTDRGNGYYSITIDNTVVADGRQDITCTVYDGENVLYEVTDSMESYAARATASTSKDLYTMIMKFSDSAKAYLKSKLQSA